MTHVLILSLSVQFVNYMFSANHLEYDKDYVTPHAGVWIEKIPHQKGRVMG
jgi:hypothetical protein